MSKLPASVAKQNLLHPEPLVRLQCLSYFNEVSSDDPEVVARVFEATERYGRQEAFGKYFFDISKLHLDEHGLLLALTDIEKQPDDANRTLFSYREQTISAIADCDVGLLARHLDRVNKAIASSEAHVWLIAMRIGLSKLSPEELWRDFSLISEPPVSVSQRTFIEYLLYLKRLGEAIGAHRELADRVLQLLSAPMPPDDFCLMARFRIGIIAAGKLRLEEAIEPLVGVLLNGEREILMDEARKSLACIGTQKVADAVLEKLPGANCSQAYRISGVLKALKTTDAAARVLALLPDIKDDPEFRQPLLDAALSHLETDAIEPARSHLLNFPDGSMDWLLAVAIMSERTFPEFDEWLAKTRDSLQDDCTGKVIDELDKLTRAMALMETLPETKPERPYGENDADEAPRAMPVHVEPKAGRNDPCPCGSGKKYKKCCLN